MSKPIINETKTNGLTLKRRLMIYGAVGLAHAVVFAAIGLMVVKGEAPSFIDPIIVELVRPVVKYEPIDEIPVQVRGGGKSAATSIVRPVPVENVREPELVAPTKPVVEQPMIVGPADEAAPVPQGGAGGEGGGQGTGVGLGEGSGRGQGPRIVRGPTQAELRAIHPREAFRRRMGGRATLSCRIRLDQRLEACSVVRESPDGMGFGQAALLAARHFRFEPAKRGGEYVVGTEIQVGVEWP